MKLRSPIISAFCLATLLSAHAQTPATTPPSPNSDKPTPKSPGQRAAAYKGPKVVKDTKALGTKMIRGSKPDTEPLSKPSPR